MRQELAEIYFVRPVGMVGPIKIGCSTDVVSRLNGLMCWSPIPLEILATIPGNLKLEKAIHECFADAHSHHEWFRPVPTLLSAIAALQSGALVGEAFDFSTRKPLPKSPAKANMHPPSRRRHMSYTQRAHWALKRLSKATGERHIMPAEVSNVIDKIGHQNEPEPSEIATLELFCSDPAEYFKATAGEVKATEFYPS